MAPLKRPAPLNTIQILEGAAALMKLARNIDNALGSNKDLFVRLRRSEMIGLSASLKRSAEMVDRLVSAVEHGDSFDDKLPDNFQKKIWNPFS